MYTYTHTDVFAYYGGLSIISFCELYDMIQVSVFFSQVEGWRTVALHCSTVSIH